MRRWEVLGTKEVGAHARHLQCAWRVTRDSGTLFGSGDLYLAPGDDPYADYGSFDWTPQGANRADDLVDRFLSEHVREGLLVESLEVGTPGAFRLLFSAGLQLDVLPSTSVGEYWRFFRPGSDQDHFVMTDQGIEV